MRDDGKSGGIRGAMMSLMVTLIISAPAQATRIAFVKDVRH